MTSDPARLKKTFKDKKNKPTHLRKVHPAHDLNALAWTLLLLSFLFHDYLVGDFPLTVDWYLVIVKILLCVHVLQVSHLLVHSLVKDSAIKFPCIITILASFPGKILNSYKM